MRIRVYAQHPAAGSRQNLDRHESDQPQPRHHHGLAQGRLRQSDTLQGDGPQRGEGGVLIRHIVGHFGAEIGRSDNDLGMPSVGNQPIPDLECAHTAPGLKHTADVAITESHRLTKLRQDRVQSRRHPVRARLLDDLTDLVGLLFRLRDQRSPGKVNKHPLGSSRNQRYGRGDPQGAAPDQWRGHVFDQGRTRVEVLQDLFHYLLSGFNEQVEAGVLADQADKRPWPQALG